EPAVAGERVPHHRHDDEEVQLDEVVLRVLAEHDRRERKQDDKACEPAGDGAHPTPRSVSRMPPACIAVRATSTARKTRCPESAKYSGLICAPTACATPSTIPPPSVPQSEPMPPMTTASKAYRSCAAPALGSNEDRIP